MDPVPVSRCLDKKLQIAGFEVPDILCLFLMLTVLHFLFGQTPWRFSAVWLPTAGAALVLRIGKRGKEEGYLLNAIKFAMRPGHLSAFEPPKESKEIPR